MNEEKEGGLGKSSVSEREGAELSVRDKYKVLSLMADCGASDIVIKSVQKVLEGVQGDGGTVWVTRKKGAKVAGRSETTFGNHVKNWPVRTKMIGERLHYHEGDIVRFLESED
ncbi:hypothetical protein VDG1235_2334 [Verrucomicrobiia bacterium DG1235]|nr:hypothetical protein VDG1235_2334 [Verrucomicrobiae bacterium DG1235]